MNVVREINKINERELELGTGTASWHDDYKDSAYIFVGGLNFDMTEGDVITVFSQYGEIMDVNLPRNQETGKIKGFGFLMYEDQRSTILAVDNLNGAKVLDRTLRVDHVKNYKQPKVKGEDGELRDREEQSLNAKPEMITDDVSSESSESSGPEIDPEDPMAAYLLEKRREEKAKKKGKKLKSKKKHKDETPEGRGARKEKRREKKALKASKKSQGLRGVEELLQTWAAERPQRESGSRSRSPRRLRSRSPDHHSRDDRSRNLREPSHRYKSPTDQDGRERRPRKSSRERERADEASHDRTVARTDIQDPRHAGETSF
ncbi:CWF29 [Sanghuangporus weigelae]